ncbi:APC family permease [Modicisalibacter radicis]|uniref:APC family permease n=1 Tax=Halomonas sp. EAR18 TaxID=2518972 RepID=UPI001B34AA54|nr:APC family permease [Halomonas sp. EAR18]
MSPISTARSHHLERSMGLTGAIATVVAGTLGAGLFVTLGTASSTTGPSIIVVVVATGILAMAIATNYSWIASVFPGAGGAYTYISRTFDNRLPGFVVTWSKWLGYMAADAVLALGFGSYLKVFYPAVDPAMAGFVLLSVLFLVNLVGTKSYSVVQNVIFLMLIVSVLVLVLPGIGHIRMANYQPFFTGGVSGLAAATVPMFYAYIGIAVAAQMGAEVKRPQRNLPLAMVGGTGILIALYLLTAVVLYGVVEDYRVLAESERPLATASQAFLGEYGTAIVAFGGLLATASSVHAVMAAAIKMPYAWAWDEVFPQCFSVVSRRFHTPHWSLLTLYIVSSALIFWSAGLDQALSIATFSYLIAYLTVSLTVGYVYLRRADIRARAAFQPGGWFWLPIGVGVLGSSAILFQAANWGALFSGNFAELSTLAVYLPWLAIGLLVFTVYWALGRRRGDDVTAILATIPGVVDEPPTDRRRAR